MKTAELQTDTQEGRDDRPCVELRYVEFSAQES